MRSVLAVFNPTGWTKPAFTAEGNKFKIPAFGTGIHCPTESRVTTAYHLVNVVNDSLTGM
nr:hypothetical protein [Phocaeicola sartorii]